MYKLVGLTRLVRLAVEYTLKELIAQYASLKFPESKKKKITQRMERKEKKSDESTWVVLDKSGARAIAPRPRLVKHSPRPLSTESGVHHNLLRTKVARRAVSREGKISCWDTPRVRHRRPCCDVWRNCISWEEEDLKCGDFNISSKQ